MRRVGLCLIVGGAVCFALLAVFRGTSSPRTATELKGDQPNQAAAFRHFKRLSEGYRMPENALLEALSQMGQMRRAQPYQAGIFPGSWTWLGPGNIGGRIRAILVHPTNPNTIWAGTATGGVWKTTNGGASWFPLEDFMASLAIGCMAMHVSAPDTLYVGSGEGFAEWPEGTSNTAFVRGIGILKTVDGGETWVVLPSTSNSDFDFVNRIAIDPNDPQVILAATASGIWRSANAGNSWTRTFGTFAYDVKFHPTDSSRAIAGLHDSGAVVSTNGGVSWVASTGITGHRTELVYFRGAPSTIYAGVSDAGRIKIYRSTDGGATFALRTSGAGITTYEAYNSTLWVDPTDSSKIIVGGVNFFKSGDGGVTLAQGFSAVHADMHVITEHPQFNGTTNRTVFFGCDGGVYRTTDTNGTAATGLNNNMGVTQFYGAVVNPISGVAFGGTQDNGTLRGAGNPQAWTSSFGGDGTHAATDPADSNYFYGAVQNARLFRSSNGGTSASYIYNSSTPITDAGGSNTNFVSYFTLDPNDSNRMYVCCRRLWRSNNVKASPTSSVVWTAIKPSIGTDDPAGFPAWAHFSGNSPFNISTVAAAEGNPDLVWVGHNNGHIYKSTNATLAAPTWTRIDDDAGPMPLRWVSKIVIDPSNHSRVYVAFMGWESDNIWRTIDGGTSWSELTGSGLNKLPSAPMSALAMHRTEPGWLYAGSDIGIFCSTDDGQTWTMDNQGPAVVPIDELNWINNSSLLAVTHGRGLYRATIDPQNDPISPLTFSVAAGIRGKGPLSWLYLSDDKRIGVQADLVTADFIYPAAVVFSARIPHSSVQALRFTLEASISATGMGQQVEFFDYVSQEFVPIAWRYGTLADSTMVSTVSVNANRYIEQGTLRVLVRVGWFPIDVDSSSPWSVSLDQAFWTAVR